MRFPFSFTALLEVACIPLLCAPGSMRVVLAQLKSDVEQLSRQIKLEYSYLAP
jgi:hypothetical protein